MIVWHHVHSTPTTHTHARIQNTLCLLKGGAYFICCLAKQLAVSIRGQLHVILYIEYIQYAIFLQYMYTMKH